MGGLEGPVYEGELVRCIATLRNTGALPLQSLRLLIAQPDLLCCPSQAHLATSLAAPSGPPAPPPSPGQHALTAG